jgi:uncharacterized protein (TIGR02680 family)
VTGTIERLRGSGRLPRPEPGRMRPLRAGILNVWEYDEQEFWFSGGRLILRGQNTAGKSKALELLFPFVLDGDTRPQRLDPFGSVSKTMYWNLIGFAETGPSPTRESAIGYCWAEFGCLDEDGRESYVTCVVGLRAVRAAGRRVDTWFAVTPARIGQDLDLAPAGVPLTAERFRAALPERSVYSTTAREHRAAVDHALFGLGPERYDALVHLLLQLRRPKLSEKLDMSRLGEYLSDALPPLEQHRVERLATAFARLEEESAALERLEACAQSLQGFLAHYRAHAQLQTRLRADEVRSANTQFDRVTEKARLEREKHDRATDLARGIDERLARLAAEITDLRGRLEGLDLSKVHALEEVAKRAAQAYSHARSLEQRAAGDRRDADRAGERSTRAAAREAVAASSKAAALRAATGAAEAARVSAEHGVHSSQLEEAPERARMALRGVSERREERVRQVQASARAAESARQRIAAEQRAAEEAEAGLDAARRELSGAEADLERAAAELVQDVASWSAHWQVPVPDDTVEALVAGQAVTARALLAGRRQAVAAERASLLGRRALVAEQLVAAAGERERVEAETDLAPPVRPGRPAQRPAGFVPLWAAVDFDPSLAPADRAGLEAALEASGVLDALIGPEGQVLDPATLDTLIDASPGSLSPGSLSPGEAAPGPPPPRSRPVGGTVGGLVPAGPHAGPAESALAALGAAGRWSADGKWTFGPLAGRWTKGEAEYIGAAARAEARGRRIAELTAAIVAAEAELRRLDAALSGLDAESARLDEAEAAWPSADGLRDARRDRDRAAAGVADAAARAEMAGERLTRSRAEGKAALDALAAAEQAAGCSAPEVDEVLSALARYREALGEATAAVQNWISAVQAAAEAADLASASQQRAEASESAAAGAAVVAGSARAEEEELRRTSGADADAVLARQRELTGQLESAELEQVELRARRDQARDEVIAARTLLARAEEDRAERERARADALARLAALASTELALLAVGPVDRDRDLTQVTAGLGFARAAYERLREVEVDQRAIDAVATRFHHAWNVLQSGLGVDFNPNLDTSGGLEVCFATLNGRTVALSELAASIDEQVRRRRETLTAEEREVIHRHLLTEVGSHLGERVHAAWAFTKKMNEQLAAHPTRGGVSLELAWEVAPDAGAGAEQAARLLRREVGLLDEPERAALANFLHDRVRTAREEAEGADMVERLAAALDYRRWHRFSVHRLAAGRRERLTGRTQGVGSGGEQAKLAHLPLFAATAAYYASARPGAPHLLMLDEAFAGIDDNQRGDCMGILVELDLDMVLTNYSEWGCYREIPSVATYHLERTPGRMGVTALRFVWDGQRRREDDPWLEDREEAEAAPGGGLFS